MRIIGLLLLALFTSAPALAAGITVTPEMRRTMEEKMLRECLQKEGEFLKKGYSRTQTHAICRCATQQTAALLNSRTVSYILANGTMPADMQRKVASATAGCIRTVTRTMPVK
jgi:hypothetical protein